MPSVQERFQQQFALTPKLFRAPGRINLIGEHIDYHNGYVFPAAVHFQLDFAVGPAEGDTGTLVANDLDRSVSYRLEELTPGPETWANYLLGVMAQLKGAGYQFPPVNVVFGGDIPFGAGLSSSAAVECGLALALDDLFDLGIDRMQLAQFAQAAEHTFVGVQCGLMDQFASLFGKTNHLVRLDCRSLDYEYFPFPGEEWGLVLIDTKVEHALADGGYNKRRKESEDGLAAIQALFPEVKSLRDVAPDQLEAAKGDMSEVSYRRCGYVLAEIQRVLEASEALQQGDMSALGQLMYGSHQGLQYEYEVSCPELDFLVDQTRDMPKVKGARMMGWGFGGCTINLVAKADVNEVAEQLRQAYVNQYQSEPGVYITQISEGASAADL